MTVKGKIIESILLRWRGAAVTGAPLFERAEAIALPSIVGYCPLHTRFAALIGSIPPKRYAAFFGPLSPSPLPLRERVTGGKGVHIL